MPCHDADSTCDLLWHFSGKYFLTGNHISCFAVTSLSARLNHNHVSLLVGASLTWSLWNASVVRTGNWSTLLKHDAEKPLPWYLLCAFSYYTASYISLKQWSRSLREKRMKPFIYLRCVLLRLYTVYVRALKKYIEWCFPNSFARGRILASKGSHGSSHSCWYIYRVSR
jgi:hypothetical protein